MDVCGRSRKARYTAAGALSSSTSASRTSAPAGTVSCSGAKATTACLARTGGARGRVIGVLRERRKGTPLAQPVDPGLHDGPGQKTGGGKDEDDDDGFVLDRVTF